MLQQQVFFMLLFLLILTNSLLFAQKAGLNQNGEPVIFMQNGNWRHLQKNNPEDQKRWQLYQDSINALIKATPQVSNLYDGLDLPDARVELAKKWLSDARKEEKDAVIDRLLMQEDQTITATNNEAAASMLAKKYAQEKQATDHRKSAEEALKLAEKLRQKPENSKWIDAFNKLLPAEEKLIWQRLENAGSSLFYDNASVTLKKYNKEDDVYFFPPPSPCQTSSIPKGETTKALKPAFLFSYTTEKLKPFLREEDFINCNATLSKVNQKIYLLQLDIRISSHLAREEFGFLDKQSLLVLYLIDGTKVYLYNHKTDTGELNEMEKTVSYRPEYVIEKADKKLLESSELTEVRIIWSTGYENYPIYEMDFFTDRLPCLD